MFPIPLTNKNALSTRKPTGKPSLSPSPSLVLQAAEDSGQPPALVQAAVNGYATQIRNMQPAQAAGLLQVELERVAESYGARGQASPTVVSECTQLVMAKFPGLGVNEIREAYRMKAAGELEMPKGKGEMWGGVFNADQLGAILSAYMAQRKKALGAYLRLAEAEKERAEKENSIARKQAAFEAKFPALVEKMKKEARDWRDCPFYLYESARRRGLFRLEKEEAEGIFQDAIALARMEKQQAYEEASGANVFRLRELHNAMLDQEGIEARAKVVARQLTLYRKLVLTNK